MFFYQFFDIKNNSPYILGMDNSIRQLLPKNKSDTASADSLVQLGYPAVEPILSELLFWLQDEKWLSGQHLLPLLRNIGMPLVPHLRKVFETDNIEWQANVIYDVILYNHDLIKEFNDILVNMRNALLPDYHYLVDIVDTTLNKHIKWM